MMFQISGNTSRPGVPNACGCLAPIRDTYASLYNMTSSRPHHTRIGNRECRHVLTMVRRLWGQPDTGPSGVADQSRECISAPISPPPGRTGSILDSRSAATLVMRGGVEYGSARRLRRHRRRSVYHYAVCAASTITQPSALPRMPRATSRPRAGRAERECCSSVPASQIPSQAVPCDRIRDRAFRPRSDRRAARRPCRRSRLPGHLPRW